MTAIWGAFGLMLNDRRLRAPRLTPAPTETSRVYSPANPHPSTAIWRAQRHDVNVLRPSYTAQALAGLCSITSEEGRAGPYSMLPAKQPPRATAVPLVSDDCDWDGIYNYTQVLIPPTDPRDMTRFPNTAQPRPQRASRLAP